MKNAIAQPTDPRFSIPPPPIEFTGRETELRKLLKGFNRGVLITGQSGKAGVGKTALARALAYRLAERFPDGRLEIDLQGSGGTSSLGTLDALEAMRKLLQPFFQGPKLPENPQELRSLYKDTFRRNKVLILLDDVRDEGQVSSLLPPPPSATIITTRSATLFNGLDLPLPRLTLEALNPVASRRLLGKIAPRLGWFSTPLAYRLAAGCLGIPQVLRLAGATLQQRPDWSIDDYLRRLSKERKKIEEEYDPFFPAQDVSAALAVSYQGLGEQTQARFRALAVFTAPFSREAVAAVWRKEIVLAGEPSTAIPVPLSNEEVSATLAELVAWRLVEQAPAEEERNTPTRPTGRALWRLIAPSQKMPGSGNKPASLSYHLETQVRLFALRQLCTNVNEAREVSERHAMYFLDQGTQAELSFTKTGEQRAEGRRRFTEIWPHLEAAWRRMAGIETCWPRPESAEWWLSNFAENLAHGLDERLAVGQRLQLYERALLAARRQRDRRSEATHLGHLGEAWFSLGDARRGLEQCEQALAIAHEISDERAQARFLGLLGIAYRSLGNPQRSVESLEAALAIHRKNGDRHGEADLLAELGGTWFSAGEPNRAGENYQAALALHRETGDKRSEGLDLGLLGNTHQARGEVQQAIALYQQALVIYREIGDRHAEGNQLGSLGIAFAIQGDPQQAAHFFAQALSVHRQTDERRTQAIDLGYLGSAALNLKDLHRALDCYKEALEICRETGDRQNEGVWLGNLGNAYWSLGKPQRALELYQEALALARLTGDRLNEANWARSLGNAHQRQGNHPWAIEAFGLSLAVQREMGNRLMEGIDLTLLGDTWQAAGNLFQAVAHYELALAIAQELRNAQGEWILLNKLGDSLQARGEMQKAISYYEQALPLVPEAEGIKSEEQLLLKLVAACQSAGEMERASKYRDRILAIQQERNH